MKTPERARELAQALVRVGTAAGKHVTALLTDMSAPLGRAVGNAVETREAIAVLRGEGPEDLVECTLALGAEMLALGGVTTDRAQGRARLERAIGSGDGARVAERMIEAQGGDPAVVAEPTRLPRTKYVVDVQAESSGVVSSIDCLEIGLTSVAMGAGRTRVDQAVDHAVGIELVARRGEPVERRQTLARLHVHRREDAEEPAARVRRAFNIGPDPVAPLPVVLGRVEA